MIFSNLIVFLIFSSIIPNESVDYLPEETKQLIADLHHKCVAKLGIATDLTKDFDFTHVTPEIMCYMKCLMIEGQWAGEDEMPLHDEIIKATHPEIKDIAQTMLDKCRNIPKGNQECETTYNFFNCLRLADPEHFYMH